MSETKVEEAPTGQKIIISREVKPIKHRRLIGRFSEWMFNPSKKSAEERRLEA